MSFKFVSFFNSGGHFVQQSKTIHAILIEGILRNIYLCSGGSRGGLGGLPLLCAQVS